MTASAIAVGLVKTFGKFRALDGLDLTVRAGEVHGFLGPNGAGKTTTIRVFLGLLRADAGEIQLLGGDPWRDAVALHRRLAYVPGEVALWPKLSGANFIDSFLGTTLLVLALIGSGFAVQAALRLRSEETGLRAESILATPISRRRWVASHLVVAVGGGAGVLLAGGFGLGLAYALTVGDIGEFPRVVAGALAYLPATAVLVGLSVALFGLAPRAGLAMWGVLAGCFVIGFFGELLDLPSWLTVLSPFEHTPLIPAEGFDVLPLLAQSAVAAVLGAVGMARFCARDIG